MGFDIDGEEIPFVNQPPYNDIIHWKNAYSDFHMRGNTPLKKTDKAVGYSIGYKKVHKHGDIEFDMQYVILYDLESRCVNVDYIMSSNQNVAGKLVLTIGDNKMAMPVQMMAGVPIQTKRVLSVI